MIECQITLQFAPDSGLWMAEQAADRELGEVKEPFRPAGLFELSRERRVHAAFAPGLPVLEVFQERGSGQAREVGHGHGLDETAGRETDWVELEKAGEHAGRGLGDPQLQKGVGHLASDRFDELR